MKIQVFGTNCAACKTVKRNVDEALRQTGIDCAVEHVTRLAEMIEHGITGTPALKINGELKSVGRALDVETIKQLLTAAVPEAEVAP